MSVLKTCAVVAVIGAQLWLLWAIRKLQRRDAARAALEARHKQRVENMRLKAREMQTQALERVTGGGDDV